MKRLLFLLMTVLLLAACGNDEPKKDEEPAVTEETPKQDEVKEEPVKEDSIVEQPEAEESIAEYPEMTTEEATELIEYAGMGEDDKLASVSVENGEIKVVIELAPHDLLPAKNLAASLYSQASDELLTHDGWEVLTVEYVDIGTISMNRSEKESNEYGDYFPTMKIDELLGVEY